jgi:hypothetical protein
VKALEHDPEKWIPVFRKDHAPSKSYRVQSIQPETIALYRGGRYPEKECQKKVSSAEVELQSISGAVFAPCHNVARLSQ